MFGMSLQKIMILKNISKSNIDNFKICLFLFENRFYHQKVTLKDVSRDPYINWP